MKRPLLLLLFILVLGCGASLAADVSVVTSIYPLKDLVHQVGGEKIKVDFIVPPGASPHTFEPKPSDMKKISTARLLVIIGAGFEFWADKAVKSAGKKDLKVLVLSEGMPLIRGDHHHGEEEKDHGEEAADPHIWLDPLRPAAIDGKRGQMFYAFYRPVPGGVARETEYQVGPPERIVADLDASGEDTLLVGNGALLYRRQLQEAATRLEFASVSLAFPVASSLLELSVPRFQREEAERPEHVVPLYVRKSDAELNWAARTRSA